MNPDFDALKDRFKAAWDEQQRWFWRWDRCFELVIPERSFRYVNTESSSVAPYIYDTTAAEQAERLSNQMISLLTPSGIPWLRLTPGPAIIGEKRLIMAKKLQPINEVIAYYVQKAGFSVAAQPAFLDMMVTAGAIKVEPDPKSDGFCIKTIPITELAYRNDLYGRANHVYRKYPIRCGLLLAKDEYKEKLSEDQQRAYRENPNKSVDLVCSVEPEGEKFRYVEWVIDGDIILEDRSLDRNPFFVFGWSGVAGSNYRRGPALIKYHDILNTNTLSEYQLKAAGFDLLGIWGKKDDGVINTATINLYPGAQILMESLSAADPSMRRIDATDGTRYRIGQETLNDKRETIVKAFFGDKFSPVHGDKMSAQEIMQRNQDMSLNLGATWGRIDCELLRPFSSHALEILKSQNAFDGIDGVNDDVLRYLNIDNKQLDVRFMGTLSQAQYMQTAQGLIQFMGITQSMAQVAPEVSAMIDYAQGARDLAEAMLIPPSLIEDEEKMKQIQGKALDPAFQQQQLGGGMPPIA